MTSGFGTEALGEDLREGRPTPTVRKPYEIDELSRALARVLAEAEGLSRGELVPQPRVGTVPQAERARKSDP
jgi:hypothetical protein